MSRVRNGYRFIDLFAGIGGFHIALHNLGCECVFASEKDPNARKTYEHNFSKISPRLFTSGQFNNDIRTLNPRDIPDFDILCAGFPCQPFSQAGYKRGFNDYHQSERGNLFFNIAEIIQEKKPKAFFLENVRGLLNHNNGKTFQVICEILENELGYSIHYKIVQASDYGLPQLRPRIFIIGFRDKGSHPFSFPEKIPLKYTMSDIWGGDCNRQIGYTLRVGGRGSNIEDRRNWDAYLVEGEIRQLGIEQGKKMQGFPDDFEFPVSATQAMKQLGNSVAIDAVQIVASAMINHLKTLPTGLPSMKETKNKGEWTELLVFAQLLKDQKFYLSNEKLEATADNFTISKITNHNIDNNFLIINKSTIHLQDKKTGKEESIQISDILNDTVLNELKEYISNGKGTFSIPAFADIQKKLYINNAKGGNSYQKADIILDIKNETIIKQHEGFSIKSYLGNNPTLLNASGNTNFIFEVQGISASKIDEINQINTKTKLKDRLNKIEQLGGTLQYKKAEKESLEYNLRLSDSLMPEIIGEILINFYKNRIIKLTDIVDQIAKIKTCNGQVKYGDKAYLEAKIKKLLLDILLGFFAGSKWNGEWLSNGVLIMKKDGEILGFHIIDLKSLKNYLFRNIKLDTPSTTRHRFGKLYQETDGKLYFKLNLQLRF